MKKLQKIIAEVKQKSPLTFLFEQGHSVAQVKEQIISDLMPFFNDQQILEQDVINFLISDWVNLLRLKTIYSGIETKISSVINHYNKAKSIDSSQVFLAINKLMPFHIDSGNKFWSFLNLEVDKSTLEFEEFVADCMKDFVNIIEGLSKSLLVENLAIDRINRGKTIDVEKIRLLDLGVIVDELASNSPFPQIFRIAPENLRLSDWRNIGAHHGYKLKSGEVICEYGSAQNKKSINLSKDELLDRLQKCIESLEILNIAHKFFGFENGKQIIATNPVKSGSEGRIEMGFLMFTSSVWSQGFEIIDINIEIDESAIAVLKDLTSEDSFSRSIHASQLIHPLWQISKCKNLVVEYQEKSGELFLRASSTDNVCKKIGKDGESLKYLADNVKMDFVKLNVSY